MHDLVETFLNEQFETDHIRPEELDDYLAAGWRHFGTEFFRYNLGIYDGEIRRVLPLRIRLSEFSVSKSQARILRKNRDLRTEIGPIRLNSEVEDLFHRHKLRFRQHPPDSLSQFLSTEPDRIPCEGKEAAVYDNDRLVAASFFDVGADCLSGVYAVFDPALSERSLGIFTMLKEIEFARQTGRKFYYQGYCYSGNSFYDYKKRFHGTEAYGWNGEWEPLRRAASD